MMMWWIWKGGGLSHIEGRRRCCSTLHHQIQFLILSLLLVALASSEPPVPDDCQSRTFEDGGLALDCSLSAINSDAEKTNFSVLPSEHTKSLTVKCRDPILSQLEADGLRSLRHLKSLTLDGCHLRSIPSRAFGGLTNLVSLTVVTRNAGVLVIEADAFAGLPNLETLDLSGNYIRHVSPGALCALTKLSSLNLSKNELSSMSDLGIDGNSCGGGGMPVKILDMSSNALNSLTGDGLSKWPQLQELKLSNNYLRGLDKTTFSLGAASRNLRLIDLSNNQLNGLHRSLFKGGNLRHLDTLILANNTFTQLPDTLFDEVTALKELDLSGNFLTSITSRLLNRLHDIQHLDLSQNEIENIHAQAFSGLKRLKYLRLDSNRLSKIPKGLLRSCGEAIQTLVLSDNAITRLSSQLFANLAILSHLGLDKNLLEDLPNSLFANTSNLKVLDLSHNRFTMIPEAVNVSALQSLQSLSLSGNLVSSLGNLQMPSLWRLEVSDNRLSNVTSTNLGGLPGLQVLDLSNNQITTIEKAAFGLNRPLKALRLDSNR